MRTTELIFGKGKQEYLATGIFLIWEQHGPLDLDKVKVDIESLYARAPWRDTDNPTEQRVTHKVTRFEHAEACNRYVQVELHLHYRLRKSQLRSFEQCMVAIEGGLLSMSEYVWRQVVTQVRTMKEVGHWAH
jgi:hypothetical protein